VGYAPQYLAGCDPRRVLNEKERPRLLRLLPTVMCRVCRALCRGLPPCLEQTTRISTVFVRVSASRTQVNSKIKVLLRLCSLSSDMAE